MATKTKGKSKPKKPIPAPGRKASFREAQEMIVRKYGPTFEKLAK